jgi:hypothetical protein
MATARFRSQRRTVYVSYRFCPGRIRFRNRRAFSSYIHSSFIHRHEEVARFRIGGYEEVTVTDSIKIWVLLEFSEGRGLVQPSSFSSYILTFMHHRSPPMLIVARRLRKCCCPSCCAFLRCENSLRRFEIFRFLQKESFQFETVARLTASPVGKWQQFASVRESPRRIISARIVSRRLGILASGYHPRAADASSVVQ